MIFEKFGGKTNEEYACQKLALLCGIIIKLVQVIILFSFLTMHSASHELTIIGNLVSKHNHIQSKKRKRKRMREILWVQTWAI
jgi:hypothetical protein